MAWTTPKTWTVGEVLTAAGLNTHLRDNDIALAGPQAATVAALTALWGGSPPLGARGMLTQGTSVIPVVWSGGWYTEPVAIANASAFVQKNAFGWGEIMRGWHPFLDVSAAGFISVEMRFVGEVYSNQGNAFANYRIQWIYADSDGGAVLGPGGPVFTSAINPSPTTPAARDSGWCLQGHGSHMWVGATVEVEADNTGQQTFGRGTLYMRFHS